MGLHLLMIRLDCTTGTLHHADELISINVCFQEDRGYRLENKSR